MKTKITMVALIAVTAGVFAYTSPHNAIPFDLRDAVADSGKFDTGLPVIDKNSGNIPVPKPVLVNGEKASEAADVRILESAMRCRADGTSFANCFGPDIKDPLLELPLLREIRRCEYLDVNLAYCLTTTLDRDIVHAVVGYAVAQKEQDVPVRTALQLEEEPVKNDRIGVIESMLRSESRGAPIDDLLL